MGLELQSNQLLKRHRNSNLELYRIVLMLLIIIHHYVVNSGLYQVIQAEPQSVLSSSMLIIGGWGKVGINCFLMITGYFMCQSSTSFEKLLRLYIQIVFYTIIIYVIFCITGHQRFSIIGAVQTLIPFRNLTNDFTSCFLVFYLFIPFLNILIAHLSKKDHLTLAVLLLFTYSILPSIPKVFHLSFNYIGWFMCVYIFAAYIRKYGLLPQISHKIWGGVTLILIALGSVSIYAMEYIYKSGIWNNFGPYFFINDSNKLLAILPAITSFMYFKDINIPHSRVINGLGAATFGVLLIHANSDTMRFWLWQETVDCIGHFGPSLLWTMSYAVVSVIFIFIICAGIDWFRGRLIEPHIIAFIKKHFPRVFHD